MTAGNLAVCFAPSVFWIEEPSLEETAGRAGGKRASRSSRMLLRKGAGKAGDRGTLDFHSDQTIATPLKPGSPRHYTHRPAHGPGAPAPQTPELSFGLALGVGGGLSASDLRVILKQKAANECLAECVLSHRALFAVRPDAITSELAPHSALVSAGISRLLRAGLSLGNSSTGAAAAAAAAGGTPNVRTLSNMLRPTRSDEDTDRVDAQRSNNPGIGALISSSKSYANFICSSAVTLCSRLK